MKFLLLHATIVASLSVAGTISSKYSPSGANDIRSDQLPQAAPTRHQLSRTLSTRAQLNSLGNSQASQSGTVTSNDRTSTFDGAPRLRKRGQCMGKLPCTDQTKSKPTPQPRVPSKDALTGPPASNMGTISSIGTIPGSPPQTPSRPPRPPRTPARQRILTTDGMHGPTMSPPGRPSTMDTPPSPSWPSPSGPNVSPAGRIPSFYRSVAGRWGESPESKLVRLQHTMPSPSGSNTLSTFSAGSPESNPVGLQHVRQIPLRSNAFSTFSADSPENKRVQLQHVKPPLSRSNSFSAGSPPFRRVQLEHTMPSPSRSNALSSFPTTTSSNSDMIENYRAMQPPSNIAESPAVSMQRAHAALSKHYDIVAKKQNPTTLDELAKQMRWMEKQSSHSLTSEYYAQQARSRRNSFARR